MRGFRGEAQTSKDIQNRVACDIEYLENWNLTLECGVILRTMAQLFVPPRSAYIESRAISLALPVDGSAIRNSCLHRSRFSAMIDAYEILLRCGTQQHT